VLRKISSALLAVLAVLVIIGAGGFVVVGATGIGSSSSRSNAQLTGEDAAVAPSGTYPSGSVPPACPPLRFFGVRGSGEHVRYGNTIGSLDGLMRGLIPNMKDSWIDYPAVDVPFVDYIGWYSTLRVSPNPWTQAAITAAHLVFTARLKGYQPRYDNSVTAGVGELLAEYNAYERKCSGHPVMFGGYSQGADVAAQAYDVLPRGARQHVILTLFGDPHFNPGLKAVMVGAELPYLRGDPPHSFLSADASHVRSWCLKGDPICNYSLTNLLGCGDPWSCAHYHYMDAYTADAARWAYNAWKKLP
jgi:hypothetical protein